VTDRISIETARRARDLLSAGLPATAPRYNLARAVRYAAAKPTAPLDGYEGERHQELARAHKRHIPSCNGGFLVDGSDLAPLVYSRADTVGAGNAGGYLVATDLYPSYIELARSRSIIGGFGATYLTDLVGNLSFGRLTGSSITTTWPATEITAPTDGTQTFSNVSLTPHQCTVSIRESRQLIEQTSPAAQAFVANDILRAIGQAADVAALSAPGNSASPVTGILGTVGVGGVSGTTIANTGVIALQAACAKRLSPASGTPATSVFIFGKEACIPAASPVSARSLRTTSPPRH
jgi:HK97 family phage major capsid protein